ncbi:MAG: phosphoenolpyruvate--protein phosphotransferase [Desulfobacterales bacterium]|nr:phosphoenolpyruvate--protein phosphotransferase [Desulfobacterales bacterium]
MTAIETEDKEMRLYGIGASPGICIGKAYLVGKEGVDVIKKYHIAESRLQNEVNRFKIAVEKAKKELQGIIENIPQELREHAYILETHMVLFKDKLLYEKTIETIENEHINAEWALKKVVSNLKAMFHNIQDSYLKERVDDIVHVSERIMLNLVGAETVNIADIDKRVILVAHDLSPADTSQIQLEKIMGFITDRGGRASHTGIIARSLEIPAVMGLDNVTAIIKNDDIIIVDGTSGIVIVHPTEDTLKDYFRRKINYEAYQESINRDGHLLAETVDGFSVQVMANIELSEEIASVIDHGGDGIGLYRTEFQYLSSAFFPSEDELFEKYKAVVEAIAPKPVVIRTLDINGDKAIADTSEFDETNPALGLRAIRYCLKNPDVFKTQLRAILRATAFGNVRILFPMISTCEEVREARRILDEAADSLEKEGVVFKRNIEVGIMIEVPSAVIMADVLAQYVDFFSIGTNDLIQYSLAIDRDNKDVAHLYHPLNPAILRMVKHVADVAREKGIKVYMCGEMAGDPIHIPILLGLEMVELSMNPQAIPAVKSMIRALKVEDARRLMKDILKQTDVKDVLKLLQDNYGTIISEKMYTE